MSTTETVAKSIQEHDMLMPGQRVVVGVSGGADSLCLLDILHSLGYIPIVAHLDHSLRPDSVEDAAYVKQIALEKGLTFVLGEDDPRPLMAEGRSPEEAARVVRYRFLLRIAMDAGVDRIAVGHTGDDQAETILLNLLRGAGATGLRGMLPMSKMDHWMTEAGTQKITLIRPLLSLGRMQTQEYCRERGFDPRRDPSNLDERFMRNRIRNELLPLLTEYNPAVKETLQRTAAIMRRVSDLLDHILAEVEPSLTMERSDDYLLFHINEFQQLHSSLRWEFVYRNIKRVTLDTQKVDYAAVSRAVDVLSSDGVGRIELLNGVEVYRFIDLGLIRRSGTRVLFRQWPQLKEKDSIHARIGEQVSLSDLWIFTSSLEELDAFGIEAIQENKDRKVIYLDAKGLSEGLIIRPYLAGERIHPLGMDGSMKVSDYFTNEKIPSLAREHWPMVVAGGEIIWIAGLRQAEWLRVEEDSKQVAVLRVMQRRIENGTEIQPVD